jgi:hypothetical protein
MPAQNLTTGRPAKNRLKLEGQVFGLLTVIEAAGRKGKRLYWRCLCQCGNVTMVCTGSLRSGATQSCGCREGAPTHRLSGTPSFRVWFGITQRCENPESRNYEHYGARGITVCAGWHSVENFVATMGQKPDGLSIDRIDNNKGYWCGQCDECLPLERELNCRWETYVTQNRNKNNNRHLTAQGRTMLLVEWVLETGIPKSTILNRLYRGWSEEDAIVKPVNAIHRRK